MIHVIGNTGQRSNQLFFFGHCLATAIDNKQDICFWTLGNFVEEYACSCDKVNVIIKNPNIYIKSLRSIYKILEKIGKFQDMSKLIQKAKTGKNVFFYSFYGWDRRNIDLVKNRSYIREFFEPQKKYIADVKKEVEKVREKYEYVIGVHIRRGDYRYWENGKYFFEFSQYKKWMKQASALMKKKGKSVFVVFSDEDVPEGFCDEDFDILAYHGTAMEDQYFLSQCDYIISTESTFAMWGQYMGKAKRACMRHADTDIDDKAFQYLFEENEV